MNIILYSRTQDPEIIEFLTLKLEDKLLFAETKQEVISLCSKYKPVDRIILFNFSLNSDLGLVKYINEHYNNIKFLIFADSIIKDTVDIIKHSEISIHVNSPENIKKIDEVLYNA